MNPYLLTLKELDQKANEYQQLRDRGQLSVNERMTFGELAKLWIDTCKPMIGITTRRSYKSILDMHLIPSLGGFPVRELKSFHLQKMINNLAETGYSRKTLKEIKNTANQIMELAMDNDIIFRNVFRKINIPKIEAQERRPLTKQEQDMLLSYHSEHRMGVPALLMMLCGLRRGELMALTWNDLDLEKQLLTVNKAVYIDSNKTFVKPPKSKAGNRNIPIPNALVPILRDEQRQATSLLVCPSAEGTLMTQSAFERGWESYMHFLNITMGGRDASRSNPKLTVIDHITPHMLRHTYATLLYDAGVDVKTAQRYLGHADVVTTLKIYTHLSEQREQQSSEALNKHFDKIIKKERSVGDKKERGDAR